MILLINCCSYFYYSSSESCPIAPTPTNTASDVCIVPGFAPKERPMSRTAGRYRSIAIASKAVIKPRATISGSVRGAVSVGTHPVLPWQ